MKKLMLKPNKWKNTLKITLWKVEAERLVTDKRGQVVEWSLLRISYAYETYMR